MHCCAKGARLGENGGVRAAGLVGRHEELAYLSATLGQNGAVVAGAAGVGKTRLTREVMATLADYAVFDAAVTAAASELPLGGISGLRLLEGEQPMLGRAGLFWGLTEALLKRASGRRPAVVIDDAHLLDDLSAAFVHHLVTSAVCPVLMTVRSGEHLPTPVVSLYKDGYLPRLELQPLALSDFRVLVTGSLGGSVDPLTLDRLWRYANGNVLFLNELLAHALEEGTLREADGWWSWTPSRSIGSRLTELVKDRMGRLEDRRRLLAELLAVGEPLSAALLETVVSGVDLAEEEQRGLIASIETGRRVEARLAHPLFAEVIRDGMPALRRRKLQRLLAGALEEYGARRKEDLLRVAIWRVESASSSDAELLLRAAGLARQQFDPDLAVRLARPALEISRSFEAGLLLGGALSDLSRFDEAADVLEGLVGRERDGAARQRLARERAWVLFRQPGGLDQARFILDAAEATTDDPRLRLVARGDLALMLTYSGRFIEAEQIGAALVGPDVDEGVRLAFLPAVGASMVMAGRTERTLELCAELAPVADRLVDHHPRGPGLVWQMRSNALVLSGRVNEAVDLLREPLEGSATPLLGAGDLAYARTKLIRALMLQGRWRCALEHVSRTIAVLRDTDPNNCLLWCFSLGAEAWAQLGETGQAIAMAGEAVERPADGFPVFDQDAARARAWVLAAQGERSRAVDDMVAAAEAQEETAQPAFALFAWFDAFRLGCAEAGRRVEALAGRLDGPWPSAAARYAAGTRQGDPEEVDGAARAFAAAGLLPFAVEAGQEGAKLWSRRSLLARAADTSAAVENWRALTDMPTGRMDSGPSVLDTLTRREREIVSLAARGMSNSEVAQKLVISVRTVESHLYAAYAKLGVSDRADLARLVGPQ